MADTPEQSRWQRAEAHSRRLAADPQFRELVRLVALMDALRERIGRFRERHNGHSPRTRCMVCREFVTDWSGLDPHDLLASVQSVLASAHGMIFGELDIFASDLVQSRPPQCGKGNS